MNIINDRMPKYRVCDGTGLCQNRCGIGYGLSDNEGDEYGDGDGYGCGCGGGYEHSDYCLCDIDLVDLQNKASFYDSKL